MNHSQYHDYLRQSEGFDEKQATDRSWHAFSMAHHLRPRILDTSASIALDDVLRAWPALQEEHPQYVLRELVDRGMETVLSHAQVTRYALRHLELLEDLEPATMESLFGIMTAEPTSVERHSAAAQEMAPQFAKLCRHFARDSDKLVPLWRFLDEQRSAPMAAAYVPMQTLPAGLDRAAISCERDDDVRTLDCVSVRQHVDPVAGQCSDAERLHQQTLLAPDSDIYGRCTVIESPEGIPLGAVKWEYYKSMVALMTVRHPNGTVPLTRGMLYKLDADVLARVSDQAAQADRKPFSRIRVDALTVQPVRFLGENDSPVALGWPHYRALLQKAIEDNPKLRA